MENSGDKEDKSDARPVKRARGEEGRIFVPPPLQAIDVASEQSYNSRIVVSRNYWVYRPVNDLVEVIRWMVSSRKVTEADVESFLDHDNVAREKVNLALRARVTDAVGQQYLLRFSLSLDNLHYRHQHDLLRLLEHLVGNDAEILADVEGKLAQMNQAQSAIRRKLRE